MSARVRTIGGSKGVILPAYLLRELRWDVGTSLTFRVDAGVLCVSRQEGQPSITPEQRLLLGTLAFPGEGAEACLQRLQRQYARENASR